MILPFSQSKMAKEVLKVARQGSASWGQRVVTNADTARLCDILTSTSKRSYQEFVDLAIARSSANEATVGVDITAEQASLLSSLGVDAITITATQFDIATGQWVPLANEMSTGYLVVNDMAYVADNVSIVAGQNYSNSESINVATFVPAANHAGHQIVVFVIMPIRTINSVPHILQEYCSFAAFELPAA